MRALYGNENRYICEECGEKAYQRELKVKTEQNEYAVSYRTHSNNVLDQDHTEALGRFQKFYERVEELEKEIAEKILLRPATEKGKIVKIEFAGIMPSAHKPRTQLRPIVLFKETPASGEKEIELGTKEINKVKVDDLLDEADKAIMYYQETVDSWQTYNDNLKRLNLQKATLILKGATER